MNKRVWLLLVVLNDRREVVEIVEGSLDEAKSRAERLLARDNVVSIEWNILA
jgi:nickel-dependent lactate racemase